MLGISCAAAIAEEHQLAAAAHRLDAGADQAGEGIRQCRFSAPRNVVVLGEFAFEKF
jgi:hypothetical protein